MKNNFRAIIGRDLDIIFMDGAPEEVAAKVDTGAYRSALHADHIKVKDGILTFRALGNHPVFESAAFDMTTTKFNIVNVENSFGHAQDRYEVMLKVKVGGKIFKAPFTLADRGKKRYPVLLGRTLLNRRFVIDTSISQLDRKLLESHGITMPLDEEGENT